MKMIEAYILGRRILNTQRKVEENMDKVKEFITKHRNEIIIGAGIIFVYRLGFNRGRKVTDAAVTHFIDESIRALELVKF